MKLSQILRWVEVVLPLISSGIFTVIAKVFMQNHEIVNHIILALFLGGLVGVYVMYKIDRLDRIVTKNTDKLTLGEIKSRENIELRFQDFLTEGTLIIEQVQDFKKTLNEIENRFMESLVKLNDRTHNDFKSEQSRIQEVYQDLQTLKDLVEGFEPSIRNPKEFYRQVRHSYDARPKDNSSDIYDL